MVDQNPKSFSSDGMKDALLVATKKAPKMQGRLPCEIGALHMYSS